MRIFLGFGKNRSGAWQGALIEQRGKQEFGHGQHQNPSQEQYGPFVRWQRVHGLVALAVKR